MKKGKLDNETLQRLVLGYTGSSRAEVLVGSGIGEDCAVLDFGEYECVLSTDPITASVSRIGALAVHISCNDVAANGIEPLAVLLTVLLPETVTEEEIREIARQADAAAKEIGIQIVGGHTEVTDVVTQPVVAATAIGRALSRAKDAGGMAPGDLIVVTKTLALEGTAIAAASCAGGLRDWLTESEIDDAMAMIERISVVKEGALAGRIGVKAMHDITEGGVLGAVWEVCRHAGMGARIDAAALPFEPVTMTLCAALDLDPMRLISSGSMLMIVSEAQWTELSSALTGADIAANVIGRITAPEDGMMITMKNGEQETITPPGPDEIYKI